jgi:hypothetical protein
MTSSEAPAIIYAPPCLGRAIDLRAIWHANRTRQGVLGTTLLMPTSKSPNIQFGERLTPIKREVVPLLFREQERRLQELTFVFAPAVKREKHRNDRSPKICEWLSAMRTWWD